MRLTDIWGFERLNWVAVSRIALVKPEKAEAVQNLCIQMAQRGQLVEKVSFQIARSCTATQRETKSLICSRTNAQCPACVGFNWLREGLSEWQSKPLRLHMSCHHGTQHCRMDATKPNFVQNHDLVCEGVRGQADIFVRSAERADE